MDGRLRCNLILRAVVLYSTIYSSRPRRWATTSCSRAARRAQRAERGPTAASPEDGGTVKSRHCSYRSVCFVVYGNPMDDGGRRPVIRNDSLPCLGKSLTNPYALPPLPPFDPATAPVTAPRKPLLQLTKCDLLITSLHADLPIAQVIPRTHLMPTVRARDHRCS